MDDETYGEMLAQIQPPLLDFLWALEDVQQTILFQQARHAQSSFETRIGKSLEKGQQRLEQTPPPPAHAELHQALRQVLADLVAAKAEFIREASSADFPRNFLSVRNHQCKALASLYRWRTALPLIAPYFKLAHAPAAPTPGARVDAAAPSGGLFHFPRTSAHHEYALFVPEHYNTTRVWPLIVALHGAYGSGHEYIWTWVRAAASAGYVVLAPSSVGVTWSILQPHLDRQSILNMLDVVVADYSLDESRIYLTGLSDGGTFSYLLGLDAAQRFAGLAPIAGVLSPQTDSLLRARRGAELPLHVVHGVHDAIFPVASVRSTNSLLQKLGYQLTYTELPDWGHALTSKINEQLVVPWFEGLRAAPTRPAAQ